MLDLLPQIPEDKVRAAFARAGGNEIASGKFASPESSAALAANGFGWFLDRPGALPAFPGLGDLDWPAMRVDIERRMRFPWAAGRYPWLDAAIETEHQLVAVESKRHEPFRDRKVARFAAAYDRDVWGAGMAPWLAMRDHLRGHPRAFRHLDAAQLVKHAFGLVTEARRLGKAPVLVYLYAEPKDRPPPPDAIDRHRDEATAVAGATVRFAACRWTDWLARFTGDATHHAARVRGRFQP